MSFNTMKLLVKPTLITATIIYLIALLPSIILAPFSFFLYDSGKETTLVLHIFAILWLLFPITLIVSVLGSWLTNVYKKDNFVTIFLLLPIVHCLLLVTFGLFHFAG